MFLSKFPYLLQRRFDAFLTGLGNRDPGALVDPVYNRERFNLHGDAVGHLFLPNRRPLDVHFEVPADPSGSKEVTEFMTFIAGKGIELQARGVHLMLAYPAMCLSSFAPKRFGAGILHRMLKSVPGLTILGEPQDTAFPDELFFDTVYHLNRQGRDVRTRVLLKQLGPRLEALQNVIRTNGR